MVDLSAYDPLALGAMRAYCGWDPTQMVDGTDLLNGHGGRSLWLPSLHVTAVTAVSVTVPCGGAVRALTVGTDVAWDEKGELRLTGTLAEWPPGLRNVSVTWTGGYDPLPDDLAAALASMTGRASLGGAVEVKIGTADIKYGPAASSGSLLATEQWVLDRYRLPRIR